MSPTDALLERIALVVEWAVFRLRRILVTLIAAVLCCLFLLWVWVGFTARGRAPMQGRVQVAGRPVTFGTVTVLMADGTTLTTSIRPDGTYLLPHVPPGPIQVAVSSPEPRTVFQKAVAPYSSPPGPAPKAAGSPGGGAPKNAKPQETKGDVTIAARVEQAPPSTQPPARPEHAQWFRIPGRYADPMRSGLRATIDPDGATVDLDLSGDN